MRHSSTAALVTGSHIINRQEHAYSDGFLEFVEEAISRCRDAETSGAEESPHPGTVWMSDERSVISSLKGQKSHRGPVIPRILSEERLVQEAVGTRTEPAKFIEREERKANLAEQERVMVDKMIAAGVDLRTNSNAVAVDLITLDVKKMSGYRACRFLPTVAQRDRADILTPLEMFLADPTAGKYARYGVVTMPVPVKAFSEDLRSKITEFHRLISRWSSISFSKFGVQVLLRATEATRKPGSERGIAEEGDFYHFHANLLYVPGEYDRQKFKEFLKWTRKFFGSHWQDSGRIRDVRELVKYVIKPAELSEASGDELVWLFRSTQRLKLVQPMTIFRDYRKNLDEEGLRVRSVPTAQGVELAYVRRLKRAMLAPGAREAQLVRIVDLQGKIERELMYPEHARYQDRIEEWSKELDQVEEDLHTLASMSPVNLLVADLTPSFRSVHYRTPAVLVSNMTSLDDLLQDQRFLRKREEALDRWVRNGAPDVAVVEAELTQARAARAAEIGQVP